MSNKEELEQIALVTANAISKTNEQAADKKNIIDNLNKIQKSIEQTILTELAQKSDLYDKKIRELFDGLQDTRDLLILAIDEQKKASVNLSEIEIDARIARALEQKEESQNSYKNKDSNWFIYLFIAIIFLATGYFIS